MRSETQSSTGQSFRVESNIGQLRHCRRENSRVKLLVPTTVGPKPLSKWRHRLRKVNNVGFLRRAVTVPCLILSIGYDKSKLYLWRGVRNTLMSLVKILLVVKLVPEWNEQKATSSFPSLTEGTGGCMSTKSFVRDVQIFISPNLSLNLETFDLMVLRRISVTCAFFGLQMLSKHGHEPLEWRYNMPKSPIEFIRKDAEWIKTTLTVTCTGAVPKV